MNKVYEENEILHHLLSDSVRISDMPTTKSTEPTNSQPEESSFSQNYAGDGEIE